MKQWKNLLNQISQKIKLAETKQDNIEEYDKLKENLLRGKAKCEKMINLANFNDAKSLLKAEKDNDLERYRTRTVGMYRSIVTELEKKKRRENR